jgi:hypothetical protein
MEDLLGTSRKASEFKRIADRKNLEDLDPIFDLMQKAAEEGKYDLDIRQELSETQEDALESAGFDVGTFDDDDDEYEEGFRTWIFWNDPSDE